MKVGLKGSGKQVFCMVVVEGRPVLIPEEGFA